MELDTKIAVVTGAAGGIGRATVAALTAAGARVVAVDLDEDALRTVLAAADGDVRRRVADVTRPGDVRAVVDEAVSEFGRIDVFFNNAGTEGAVARIVDYDEGEFDRVMAVNVRGVFLGLKYVLPVMIGQRSGSVINTSSTAGLVGFCGLGAYTASKHAVIGLTRVAAGEVGPLGVRVNAICPGPIETRMMRSIEEQIAESDPARARQQFAERVPLRRYGEPDEIARVVCFLASDAAAYVNGAAWSIDGGRVAV